MLVIVDFGGCAIAVGPALEPDVFAVGVAGMVGGHPRRVEHREAGRNVAADIVSRVAELGPHGRRVAPRPFDPAPGLRALFVGYRRDLRAVVEAAERAAVRQVLQQTVVLFARRVGDGAPERRHIETAGVAEAAGGRAQPVHFDEHETGAVEIARRQQEFAVRRRSSRPRRHRG